DVANLLDFVRRDLSIDKLVARFLNALDQKASGFVILKSTGIGHCQNGKANWNEGAFGTAHGTTSSEASVRVATTNHVGWREAMAWAARSASRLVAKMPKQVAPEPDMRAMPAFWVRSSASAEPIAGARLVAAVSRSLRLRVSQFTTSFTPFITGRAKRGALSRCWRALKTAGVASGSPGFTSTMGKEGSFTGSSS